MISGQGGRSLHGTAGRRRVRRATNGTAIGGGNHRAVRPDDGTCAGLRHRPAADVLSDDHVGLVAFARRLIRLGDRAAAEVQVAAQPGDQQSQPDDRAEHQAAPHQRLQSFPTQERLFLFFFFFLRRFFLWRQFSRLGSSFGRLGGLADVFGFRDGGIEFIGRAAAGQRRTGQIFEQFLGGLVTVVRILGHHALQHGDHGFRHPLVVGAGIRRRLDGVRLQLVRHAAFRKRRLARQHVIPGAAQRIDVAADVRRLTVAALFRRHVIDGAHRGAGPRDVRFQRVVDGTRQPQVRDLHRAVAADQQVGRLDIAMDDVELIGVLQSGGDLLDDVQRPHDGNFAPLVDDLVQVGPVDVFHRDVKVAVGFAAVVDGDDIVMPQLRSRLSFRFEPFDERGIGGPFARQNLERHQPLQFGVLRQVDGPHSARPDLLQDLILAESARRRLRLRRFRGGFGTGSHDGACPEEIGR